MAVFRQRIGDGGKFEAQVPAGIHEGSINKDGRWGKLSEAVNRVRRSVHGERQSGGAGKMNARAEGQLGFDVDLMRAVAFALEAEQRSPPEPVFVQISDIAAETQASPADVVQALDDLRGLGLIEGPGAFADSWLFRRITAKGRIFLSEIRDPRRWREIKETYGGSSPWGED